mgnify:CR=1 FL=1
MYKRHIINELSNFDSEMTFGQMIHSIITSRQSNEKPLQWLFQVEDEDFFTALEKALVDEEKEEMVSEQDFNNWIEKNS